MRAGALVSGAAMRTAVLDEFQVRAGLGLSLARVDLVAGRVAFATEARATLALARADGQTARLRLGPVSLEADELAAEVSWAPVRGMRAALTMPGLALDLFDRACERLFLGQPVKPGIRRAVERPLVLLLLDREDIGCPLRSRKQVLAVVGIQKLAQRLDAADHQQQVVLTAEREHGIDEVVTRTLVAELDLQAVREEGEKIAR